jgi:hypothetical protein
MLRYQHELGMPILDLEGCANLTSQLQIQSHGRG